MSNPGLNRPFKFGANDRREYIVQDCETAFRAQYDANDNPIYIGKAKVGTQTSEIKWQISFQTFDASNNMTVRTWPQNSEGNASADYEFEWDDRTTYTFS